MQQTMSEKPRQSHIKMPYLNEDNEFVGGKRDYFRRLAILKENIDFQDKRVLDLGCSDGFFALSLASEAKHITAIESDFNRINRCNDRKKQLNINNVDFCHDTITTDFIDSLPNYDIIIFLAVFHHMWNASTTYDVNIKTQKEEAKSILTSICSKTDVLAFEIGETQTGHEPRKSSVMSIKHQKKWVIDDLLGLSFTNIKALPGPGYYRLPLRLRALGMHAFNNPITAKPFIRLLLHRKKIDERDFRYIYLAQK